MNIRISALEKGLIKYSSGKPCRRGHVSERYTSNGMCIMCLNGEAESKRALVLENRAKRTRAIYSQHLPHQILCKMSDRVIFNELADTLQHVTPDVAVEIERYIHALYLAAPTARALARDDLLVFMDFRDNKVHNHHTLELSHDDGPICVIRNGVHYNAEQCMDVLRGTRLNVKPVFKVNT